MTDSLDDRIPEAGSLIVVVRGRLVPRELARFSPFDGSQSREPLDPMEDRNERGTIYRVLSVAGWPMSLCAMEWSPQVDGAIAQRDLVRHVDRDSSDGYRGDSELSHDLLVQRQPTSPSEAWQMQQAYARELQRYQQHSERLKAEVEDLRAARTVSAGVRPRVPVRLDEILWKRVPEEYLAAARGVWHPEHAREPRPTVARRRKTST